MSKIGNKPIDILEDVTVAMTNNVCIVKGPKGELSQPIDGEIQVQIEDNAIRVVNKSAARGMRAKHGLYRSLISNMVEGVSKGFKRSLVLEGVGYRVQKKGGDLMFLLGYSHPILFSTPEGIKFDVESPTQLSVMGIDKQKVGHVCALIRKLRKIDPYKGKGIKFVDEVIYRKAGKSVK